MTIKGVKNQLNNNETELDVVNNKIINTKIKNKLNKISTIIKNIKKNG